MRIYLSPSTQDWNVYFGGSNEEIEMNDLALPIAAMLTAAGHTVKVGGKVSARANADDGNAWNPELYVALHSNAGGGVGTEVWYYTGSVRGQRLAQTIYNRLAPVTESPDRGVKNSTGYIELRVPRAPAVIVECAFHDNPHDSAEIKSHHAEYAQAIAQGILDVAGGSMTPPVPVPGPVPIPAPPTSHPPTIRKGSRDAYWVHTLQVALNLRGARLKVDNDCGPKTKRAVIRFQATHRLWPDGVVGPKTWLKLLGYY